jgi:3-oxoacyl-[acyl-carrier protein] reductase
MNLLQGKRVLVTGGSRGIGRACCLTMARAGARVAFTYRRAEREAQTLKREIECAAGTAHAVAADFEQLGAASRALQEAVGALKGLDILVSNAGIWDVEDVPVEQLSDERWLRTLTVNLTAPFELSRAAIPHLARSREGRIIFVSSIAGLQGEANHADYASSKAALLGLARSLAVELGPRRVTVNAIAPGWVDTDMMREALDRTARTMESITAPIPLGRVATPDDVAGAVLFLASPLSAHVTGQVLPVTGGENLGD